MFKSEVTAWRLFRKDREEEKIRTCRPPPPKNPPCHVMSCCVTSLHVPSKSHLVSFFALMWLEAEWSSTLKCVGPSIIPLCKYLHKETSRLAFAKSRESPVPGTHSFTEPYTAMTRDRERDRANSRKGAGGKWIEEKDKREENDKVCRFRLRDRNQKKRRHMDTEARWYKRFRAESGR